MPPRKPVRTVLAEEGLAQRVAEVREARGWSPAGLAYRMTQAGCPMTQSAIWKIENGEPRRRITFDEAVAFARVFEIPLESLANPPQVVAAERVARWARAIVSKIEDLRNFLHDEIEADLDDLTRLLAQDRSGVALKVMSLIASAEETEPWANPEASRAAAEALDSPDAAAVEAWFQDVGDRLRQVSREVIEVAEGFALARPEGDGRG